MRRRRRRRIVVVRPAHATAAVAFAAAVVVAVISAGASVGVGAVEAAWTCAISAADRRRSTFVSPPPQSPATSRSARSDVATAPRATSPFPFQPSQSSSAAVMRLSSSSSSPPGDSSDGHLSAAARARRDEEHRRLSRRDDVVIGRTSAKSGERDYVLDVDETEQRYLAGAGDVERRVYVLTERGLDALRMLQLEEAKDAFDEVYAIKPNAYLWQAGVVQYYLDDYFAAAETFASNARLYETKFMCPASEERIWRDACHLKLDSTTVSGKGKGNRAQVGVAEVPEKSGAVGEMMMPETRKVLRIARDLFLASVHKDHSAVALSRAKLHAICGAHNAPTSTSTITTTATPDRKMWRLNSWYYLGLHHDAMGESDESKACMKMAIRQCAGGGNGEDIMQALPVLHMTRRDWFDDDEFAVEADRRADAVSSRRGRRLSPADLDAPATSYTWSAMNSNEKSSSQRDAVDETNAIMRGSIESSIDKMKHSELQAALKKRSIKSSGTKAQLRNRLINSLLRDAGFE